MSDSYSIANPQYRDTVFRDYFNNQKRLLSLCNAVLKTKYTDENEVEINTLEGNFFSNQKNDVSCLLRDNYLVMIEHQSTRNSNMPFRFFSYVYQLFNNMVNNRDNVYLDVNITFPDPQFYVFYDGDSKEPLEREIKFSDSFRGNAGKLELIVTLYNINYELNQPLLEKCSYLNDYSKLVGKVKRGLKSGLTRRQAIISAIEWCIKNNVMSDYLPKKKDEVFGMLDWQWNMDEAQAAWENKAREAHEEGLKLGLERGRMEGIKNIIINMLHNGKTVEEIHKETNLSIQSINELSKI